MPHSAKNPFTSVEETIEFINQLFRENGYETGDDDDEKITYIDPLTLPQEKWFPCASVRLPAKFQEYLDSLDVIKSEDTNAIEIALEKYYKIEEPWYISLSVFSRNVKSDEPDEILKPLIFDLMK